ncbi:MAG: FtsX-like permease family protein [Clostridiales Family XIII bacterium]|jgi:putative ABC transport system permease protein|nr:FtsX-like permease family protein [Clostridiales Family XIII bacterium]
MYILLNAFQNLLRNRGRNLMMGGIIFVIIISVVTALMINNTANGVINDYKNRFGSEVSFVPNQEKLMEEAQANSTDGRFRIQLPQIEPEKLLAFGQSEYLSEAVYTAETKGNSDALNAIDADKGGGGGPMIGRVGPNGTQEAESLGVQYYHKISNQYSDFEDGLRTLTDGSQYPENENECILSDDLLENSDLAIGDTITVTSALTENGAEPGSETYTDISWEMTIVGTYTDMTEEYGGNMMENAYTNRKNEILTTFETISNKMQDSLSGITVDAKFSLVSPDMLEAYTAEVREKGLSDTYDVTTDENSYNRIIAPVEGLKSITFTFVIVVLIFGSIILALLASIAIRERKYEIGVLRAMGMKKLKVVLGLWSETLAITVVCLILGLGIGPIIAQPITNVMLEKQIAASEEAQSGTEFSGGGTFRSGGASAMSGGPTSMRFGGPGQEDVQPLSELDVSLDIVTILEIIAIALLLSSLAGIIATRKITKYEPIKILMERN